MPQYHNSCLRLSHKYQCKKKSCKQKNQANNTEEKAKTQTKKFPRPQRSLLAPTGALYIIVCNYLSKTSTVCFSTQRHIVSVITTKASTQQKQIFKQMMQQRNITIMSECTHIPRFPRCVTAIMSSLKVFIIQELLSRLMWKWFSSVWKSLAFIRTNHETHPKVSSGMVIVLEKTSASMVINAGKSFHKHGNQCCKNEGNQGDKDAKPCMQ